MTVFNFKGKDSQGKIITGQRQVQSKHDLITALKNEGLIILSILEVSNNSFANKIKNIFALFGKISIEEKMGFARNVGIMVGSGVSLSRALEITSRQTENEKFRNIILNMSETVKKGDSFSEALNNHVSVFYKFFVEMVRAGERSGKLEESLKLISQQLAKDYALRKKVKGAMTYPTVVVIAMFGIAVLMMTYVVPSLISTFKELDLNLPASTLFIIYLSDFITTHLILFFLLLLGSIFGTYYFFKSEKGKHVLDLFFVYAPVIKNINKKFNSARVCRTLGSLLSSGVDIVDSIEITTGVIDNHLYKIVLEKAIISIKKGQPIYESFLEGKMIFPSLVGEMMAVGEETGKLSYMLQRLATFYESEVSSSTKDLSTIIEPVLMIIIGIVVGFFAISMISPMYNLASGF